MTNPLLSNLKRLLPDSVHDYLALTPDNEKTFKVHNLVNYLGDWCR